MQRHIAGARRVEQENWYAPALDTWAGSVVKEIDRAPHAVILVAHSFGVSAAVAAAAERSERIAGALLVAPADPGRFSQRGLRPEDEDLLSEGMEAILPVTPLTFSEHRRGEQ